METTTEEKVLFAVRICEAAAYLVAEKNYDESELNFAHENLLKIVTELLNTAKQEGIIEGENKIVKAMAPYDIKADPKQYCATFTHKQFAEVVRQKQKERHPQGGL